LSKSVYAIALSILVTILAGCGSNSSQSSEPAARVNGHDISMAAYTREVIFKRLTDTSVGVDVCVPKSLADLCHKLKQTVLSDLINNEIVHEYARAHGIVISTAEFDRQWAQVFKNKFHGDNAVLNDYAKGIGYSVAEIRGTVWDDLLQQRVLYRVTQHMRTVGAATTVSELSVGSEAELHQIDALLKKGTSFAAIAHQLVSTKGQVCYQAACGVPLVVPDAFVPRAQYAIVTSRVGSIVGPFSSQQALTLIQVRAHYQKYPFTTAQVYSLRQQQFSSWLAQQVRRANVQRYAAT
jgi:hypothetical protein